MSVEYHSGGRYHYFAVPAEVYAGLLEAPSVGS
jgi:hypothetical protein